MRRVAGALAAVAGLALLSPSTTAADETPEHTAVLKRDPKERPAIASVTKVSIGIYVMDLVSVDTSEDTFKIDAYLYLKWKDPRLAFDTWEAGQDTRPVDIANVWWPGIEFVTASN